MTALSRAVEAAVREDARLAVRLRVVMPWLDRARAAGHNWRDLAETMSAIVPFRDVDLGGEHDDRLSEMVRLHRLRSTVAMIRRREPKTRVDIEEIREKIAAEIGSVVPGVRPKEKREDTADVTARALAQAVELLSQLATPAATRTSAERPRLAPVVTRPTHAVVATHHAEQSAHRPASDASAQTTSSPMAKPASKLTKAELDEILRDQKEKQEAKKAREREEARAKSSVEVGDFGVVTINSNLGDPPAS